MIFAHFGETHLFCTSIITKLIKHLGANLYTYPGGTIAPLLHEAKRDKIKTVVAKNEQGAGYMALAEANLYHRPAFTTVTSGPGITNLMTIIADAYYDSAPLIIISGQVGTTDLNRSDQLRQRGFQEVPIINMVQPITKKTFQPHSVEEMVDAIHDAIRIANSGRKGPVLIDLPMNVQLEKIDDERLNKLVNFDRITPKKIKYTSSIAEFKEIEEILIAAQKPLILLGAGAQESWKEIRHFVKKSQIPAITNLRGLGVLGKGHSEGWIGHTGTPWANTMLFEADVVLVLGSRLDVRQTGSQTDSFNNKKVIHVDIDETELDFCRINNTIKVHASIEVFISAVKPIVEVNKQWLSRLTEIKNSHPLDDQGHDVIGCDPQAILGYINKQITTRQSLITTGVGSHQHWVARYLDFDNDYVRLFTSAGHGTMGYGLPTAIGLQYLQKDTLVICVDGDGSFQMNIQELAMIDELNLNVKILLLDNNRLGLVSQFQNITFDDDPTTGNVKNPNFQAIAKAYNIEAFYLDSFNPQTIDNWLKHPTASLLQIKIKYDTPISPMLLGGQNLNAMWSYNEK